VLNPKFDARNYRSSDNRSRSRKLIVESMDALNFVDIWLEAFPDKNL
jgi:hypothetical protein